MADLSHRASNPASSAIGAGYADEVPHLDSLDGTAELWENHGWCVRASAGDHELLLWIAFYILCGRPEGRFVVSDVRVAQALVLHGPFPPAARAEMTATPFSVTGAHWSEYLPSASLVVETGEGTTRWTMAGRTHESAPPRWRVIGDCGGLEVDLAFEALSPASWFDGFDLINGYEVLASVGGTIVTGDSVALSVTGVAQHEKVHTAHPIQRSDRAGFASLPESRRHMWHFGGDESLAFSMLANQPGEQPDRINGQIVVDGQQLHFDRDAVTFSETSTWHDPRSGVLVPSGWTIDVETDAGALQLEVTAFSSAYYLWDYLRGSTSLLYWFLCDATASWSPASGVGLTRHIPYVAHTNRPFLYWGRHA